MTLLRLSFVLATAFVSLDARGDESIRLVTDFALSPDGATLAFAHAGDVWTASSDGGAVERLTFDRATDRTPRFAPDGAKIAFTSNRTGSFQVYTMSVRGGAATQHTFHSEGYLLSEFMPNGEAVLTRGSRDHYWQASVRLIEVSLLERRAERVLFDDYADQGAVAPDGKKVLYTREGVEWWRKGYIGSEASQIWMFDTASGAHTLQVKADRGARSPLWKADGSGFYFASESDGTYNLYERDFTTGATRQLTDFSDDGVNFATISRDGTTIAFRRLFDLYVFKPASGRPPRRIELFNAGEPLGKKTLRRTLSSASESVHSPDALEIAFTAGGDLFVMDTELREPVRVTHSAELEHEPLFSPDGKAIFFVSEQGGQSDLWRVERADEEQYWWRNRDFVLKRMTQDPEPESDLRISPDGTKLAYVRGLGDLMLADLDGRNARRVVTGFDAPDYDFSPDGKWLTYSHSDENFNRDVWIVPCDGSVPAFNLSVHPDNDYDPKWSLDGRVLAFVGRRVDEEVDVHWVWLRKEDADTDSRDRRLKKALEKMEKERKDEKKDKPKTSEKPKDDKKVADGKPADAKPEGDAKEEKKPELPEVKIDFADIHDRIRSIRIADSNEGGLLWLDDKKLAFNASIEGKSGLYTVEFPDELAPKFLAQRGISRPVRAAKAKVWSGVAGGQPSTINAQGAITSHSFQTQQELVIAERNRSVFVSAWRTMRDNYYDERLGNRNWDAVRRKYEDVAANAFDLSQVREVVQMMLGELNGSHLGFSASELGDAPSLAFVDTTAHLGLRFDPTFQGPGWKVAFTFEAGPANETSSKIVPGEIVLAIDGRTVDPALDHTEVLNGTLARDVVLRVVDAEKKERDVVLRPTSYGSMRGALYEEWIDRNRRAVDEKSGGKLGYLHIAGMDFPSLIRFDAELYRVGYGRDGLVIDVRANGGGSTADHLLTALTQPRHALTIPRGGTVGYPHDRQVYATWWKPIVVLCDQNSFSNAEIFAHAIKALKRGKLVGVTTAGGVISTGGTSIPEGGFLRLPFRGWYGVETGEDMELNGAAPDFEIWPLPGDMPAGRDTQLDKAIEVLLADVKAFAERPQPTLRKASERPR
jgi:tricorn protease